MKKVDVLIIGGGASGLSAAISSKSNYPDKSVAVVRKEKQVLVPCGIPYIFGSLNSSDRNVMPDQGMLDLGVEIIIDEVDIVDIEGHTADLVKGGKIEFEKVIFATGSIPTKPKWLKGADLENVFTIPKNKIYLDEMHDQLKGLKKIVTIGAGFIGV